VESPTHTPHANTSTSRAYNYIFVGDLLAAW